MLPLIALSFDPAERNLMLSKPRQQGQMVNSKVLLSVLVSGISRGSIAIMAFFFVYNANQGEALQNEKAVTATFISIILTQFVNIMCMRTEVFVFRKYFFTNKYLFIGIFVSSILMLLIIYIPFFNRNLHTGPLSFTECQFPLLGAVLYLVLYEVSKAVTSKPKSL